MYIRIANYAVIDEQKGIWETHIHHFENNDRWKVWKTKITSSHKSIFIYHMFIYLPLIAYF